ncbi:unnamed protein product [Hymenolepis diminuta]|uniref:Uncharacterized protein n=1 Tax=Hymenolepis diminuta TaxID=6216 RepID=A0A564YKL9_HYMDI|nr:unnamed protein product [Hymenolepis diminuta]
MKIARCGKVATSSGCKARRQLLNENNGDGLAATKQIKEYCQRSTDSLRTPEYVRRVRGMALAWHDMMEENRANSESDILPVSERRLIPRKQVMPY